MAIGIGDITSATATVATNDVANQTVTGSDTLLLVLTAHVDQLGTIDSVTWDQGGVGEALTKFSDFSDATGDLRITVWYKIAPTAGTNKTVRVSASIDVSQRATCITLTGVDQTTGIENSTTAEAEDAAPTVTVTTSSGDLVVDIVANVALDAVTPGADQTERDDTDVDGAFRHFASTQAGADGGVMSWTSGNGAWGQVGVNIIQAAGGMVFKNPALRQPLIRM